VKKVILFLYENPLLKEKIEKLKKEFRDVSFFERREVSNLDDILEEAEGIVTSRFTRELSEKTPNLRVIFVPWTGVDNIDFQIVRERGLMVANTKSHAKIVAERAVTLLLSLLGRVVEYHNDLKEGIWHFGEVWTSVRRKRICIVGFGGIGQEIARILKVFDCFIIAVKRHIVSSSIELADEVFSSDELDMALKKSDIVILALPLTRYTKWIINEERMKLLKGKYLVNVGRGELIKEEALYMGLKNGWLKGAAIDTWYLYPSDEKEVTLPSRYPVHKFKNIILSPHVGGTTEEGARKRVEDIVENIRSYLKTGIPKWNVDPIEEY